MRTRYSRIGNQGLLTPGRVSVGVAVLVVAVLFAMRTFFPDTLLTLVEPIQGAGDVLTAAVGSVQTDTTDRETLLAEVEALRGQNAVLAAQLADLADIQTEGRIPAGVVARPPTSPYDTLVVAAGSNEGVAVGAIAYGAGGIPLGSVERVSARTAHVALYSAPGRATDAWAGEARVPVALMGAGSGAFRATIAKDATVAVGDQVFVPGPGALPIGVVARVDTDPSSPTSVLFVRPLANPFTTTWVAIGPSL